MVKEIRKCSTLDPRVLIVGNYCHDVLIRDDAVIAESLGGAVSFISAVLDGLAIPSHYVSKVGPDLAYAVNHCPIVSSSSKTTLFHAYFSSETDEIGRHDRILKRIRSCEPILPSDLPEMHFDFGMAVGVAGEIIPETLERMLDICDSVFVDIQALIRAFDSIDGTVKLVGLKESGFFHLLPRIRFLKASAEEAQYVDVDEARNWCCVVVTNGKDGCTVLSKERELQISPFPTVQVDSTGAGDSFLGGLVAGLFQGLAVADAALLGNFFGSLTVAQIGLTKFDWGLLQRINEEVQRRTMKNEKQDEESKFVKPLGHELFIASLASAKLISMESQRSSQCNGQLKLLVENKHEEPSNLDGPGPGPGPCLRKGSFDIVMEETWRVVFNCQK